MCQYAISLEYRYVFKKKTHCQIKKRVLYFYDHGCLNCYSKSCLKGVYSNQIIPKRGRRFLAKSLTLVSSACEVVE